MTCRFLWRDEAGTRVQAPYDQLTYVIASCAMALHWERGPGLLLNFGPRGLQWRHILPPRNMIEHRVNRQRLFVPDWLRQA